MHVIESLKTGGAERVLVDIINCLPKNFTSYICCIKKSGVMAEKLKALPVQIFELNKKEGNDFFIPFQLAKLLISNRIDIVHAHNWNCFCESIVAVILARKPKIIHTIHGHHNIYPDTNVYRIKEKLRHLMEHVLSFRSFKICTVSNDILGFIQKEIGISSKKLEVVINGVETKLKVKNKSSIKIEIGLQENDFIVCFVGRLEPVKNIDELFFALRLVRKRCPDIRLLILGDGKERSRLEKLSNETNLEDCISFLGFRDDVIDILGISDLFILPSHYEGISIALLEAMSAGLPAIVSDVGGNPEVVEHNQTGLLFQPGNLDSLVESILRLYKNEYLLKKMGKNAIDKIESCFSLNSTVSKYVSIYRESIQN